MLVLLGTTLAFVVAVVWAEMAPVLGREKTFVSQGALSRSPVLAVNSFKIIIEIFSSYIP